jgi:two-component system, OmpR family, heavy metal sensor histidine kinase CusS
MSRPGNLRRAPAQGAAVGAAPRRCSHSISARLSKKLALFTVVVLGVLSWCSWAAVGMLIKERNAQDLAARCALFEDLLALEARSGGEAAVKVRLELDQAMRASSVLEVWRADGSLLHADVASPAFKASPHQRSMDFVVAADELPGGLLRARYSVDYTHDAEMGTRWALILLAVTLAAGAAVGGGVWWQVRRGLSPLRHLAAQTRLISPQHLEQRLSLRDPAEELLPWVEQFNALMQRLEQSYAQLEGFNADVAHELRTPLATLVGQTELALSRERGAESLRDTLVSNLEEIQRLSALVNDMLFLSHADRGAVARRGQPVSLAALARQVVDFHEAPLDDAGLRLQVDGDATVAVDEALFKRAVSNLVGNATRFAERGSTVVIRIAPERTEQVQVIVQNTGQAIDAQSLPRLFDRFFRADASRCCDGEQHHGLGLAIVAAIARMHAGRTLADSHGGVTRVGFTLATGA